MDNTTAEDRLLSGLDLAYNIILGSKLSKNFHIF